MSPPLSCAPSRRSTLLFLASRIVVTVARRWRSSRRWTRWIVVLRWRGCPSLRFAGASWTGTRRRIFAPRIASAPRMACAWLVTGFASAPRFGVRVARSRDRQRAAVGAHPGPHPRIVTPDRQRAEVWRARGSSPDRQRAEDGVRVARPRVRQRAAVWRARGSSPVRASWGHLTTPAASASCQRCQLARAKTVTRVVVCCLWS